MTEKGTHSLKARLPAIAASALALGAIALVVTIVVAIVKGVDIQELLASYGYYAILIITFLEGESIVILAGIASYQGLMDVWLVFACALFGSFCGDQFYFTIGRRYGPALLQRWPTLQDKTEWAFRLVRKHETLFILSFRFIYGVRNVSPFVIAMSGVPRLRFMALNFVAATIWALAFTFGGYFFGRALEHFLGDHQSKVLIGLAVIAVGVWLFTYIRRKRRDRAAKAAADEATVARAADADQPADSRPIAPAAAAGTPMTDGPSPESPREIA